MKKRQAIQVTSHVARDLLASAAAFKTEAAVIWEYVINSLQYVDKGVAPKVQVTIDQAARKIEVSDNGRGMTSKDLERFFQMHGENLDRIEGRAGRGKFGTGKSAAFGIASTFRITTVKDGLRNEVVLTRDMIERSDGSAIDPDWTVRNESSVEPNGTLISISDLNIPKVRTAPVIEYIERHLQAFRASSPSVAVNDHICTYREPEISEEQAFEPNESQASVIGNARLTIKVARAPLADTEQGIAITSGIGNLVAIEKGGVETKELGSYLFGEIDVPALDNDKSKIEAYDSSRSLQLNPQHPVAAALMGFIGSKLEKVRLELVKRAREAGKDEQARRLASEADRIATILNQDFQSIKDRLHEIRSASAKAGGAAAKFGAAASGSDAEDGWVSGTQQPGSVEQTRGSRGDGGGGGRSSPEIEKKGALDADGKATVDPAGGAGKRARPRGGFRVEYGALGKDEKRSKYESGTLTIWINLDHPVVSAALGDGKTEDPAFRRLSYEIAFTEYAIGIGYEHMKQDPQIPADDLLYEVSSTINRVSIAAAELYRSNPQPPRAA